MVELLRVLVIDVGVTLQLRDAGSVVNVGEYRGEGLVYRAGLNKLVEVSSNDDVGQGVFLEEGFNESSNGRNLVGSRLDGRVDRWSCVSVSSGASTLGGEVNVDGEQGTLQRTDCPVRYKRLTARVPRRIGWVNAAWIEVEFRVEEGSLHNSFVE